MALIFTYGTLQRGRGNNRFLEGQKFVCKAFTGPEFTLVVSGLPYLVKRAGQGCSGEVWDVDKKCLERLDMLEQHPDWYKRERITVTDFQDGRCYTAWAYLHPDIFTDKYKYEHKIVRSYDV